MPIEVARASDYASASIDAVQTDDNERSHRWLMPAAMALVLSSVAWTLAYLVTVAPGPWLSGPPTYPIGGAQMVITRGSGHFDGRTVHIRATDATGLAIVTIQTPEVDAKHYRRIRWKVLSVDPEVTIALLWRSDSAPGKINSVPLLPYGPDMFQALPQPPDWSGKVDGIALAVRGVLRQPMFIEEASIEPIDARSVFADRLHDWFQFSHWSGLSINTAIGGPLEQPVWLPVGTAVVILTAIGLCAAWGRGRLSTKAQSLSVAAIVVAGWVVLDVRWLWSRLEQTQVTAKTFAGKSPRDKHFADIDGYVYAFAEQLIRRLPSTPSRVFVSADDHYFGGRLAYHLYPHNAYMNHDTGALPSVEQCKPDDFIVVFRRKGVVYDTENRMLSWDQQRAIPADILIAHQGNAAFRLR